MEDRCRGEAGVTLMESVVAIAIMAMAFTVFVGGMFTSVLGSDSHRKQANAETALRQFAEATKTAAYVDCASTTAYPFTAPTGTVATIPAITYWTGSAFVADPPCPSPDKGLQRISLRVASSDNRDVETVDIVKRRP